jgi:hypothetical protein
MGRFFAPFREELVDHIATPCELLIFRLHVRHTGIAAADAPPALIAVPRSIWSRLDHGDESYHRILGRTALACLASGFVLLDVFP